MPRNVTVTFEDGSTAVYQNAPDAVTPEQVTARAQQEFGKRVSGLDGGKEPSMTKGEVGAEVGRVADKAVRGGLTALPGLMGDAGLAVMREVGKPGMTPLQAATPLGLVKTLAQLFGATNDQDNAVSNTKFGDVTKTIQTAGGLLPPVSQPQTEVGKAAGNTLETAVSTVAGGGAGTIGQKATLGLAAGAGGEGAARVFGDNPIVRFLGSLVAGGGTAAIQAHRPNAEKLIREATDHMTDADWQKAQQLEQILNAAGIPHAKSQLLGPRSTLDDVVQTASANPSVRPKVITATQGAPAAAEKALGDWTVKNLPVAGPQNRAEVLTDVQEAAAQGLRVIKDKSNAKFVAAMPNPNMQYAPDRVAALYKEITDLAKSPKFGETSDGGRALLKFADRLVEGTQWDTSKVNPNILRWAQAEAKANGVPFDPSNLPGAVSQPKYLLNAHKINNLNKELKLMTASDDFKGLPLNDLRQILNRATPEFDAARAAKKTVIDAELNPAKQGLLGQIAQMGGGVKPDKLTARDTALTIVFNPTQAQGQAIKDMAKQLGPKGGEQVGELLREHIGRTMQNVLRTEDKSPRSFVQALYESPAQKENIDSALEVVAKQYGQNPDAVKVGFKRLMESLDSFKDLKVAGGVSPGTTSAKAGANPMQAATPLTTVRRFFEQKVTASSYNKIADLVLSPDGLKRLQAIAKEKNPALLQQLVVSTLTSANQTPKSGD